MNRIERISNHRWLLFSAWIAVSSILFVHPLIALVRMSVRSDDASYLIFIPFIAGYVLFIERQTVLLNLCYDIKLGGILFLGAACVSVLTGLTGGASSSDTNLPGYILALVILWMAGFTLLFGRTASKAGSFPLLFLLLTIPFPQPLLDRVIYLLQIGSAWITGIFFDLFGVPALREGFVFHLTGVNIEVAKECSGIRSSMALLILALLIAHFQLKALASKLVFVLCGLLMMVLKNGIRIATLTLLAMYVDPSFLFGRLHQQGGVIFFLLGLLLLFPLLILLKRAELWWRIRQMPQVPRESAL